jgi:tRNA A37 threonylcarbamoyladenosine dehydratase
MRTTQIPVAMMSKTEQAALREQRLAAKLRENLKRRKGQAKARADSEGQAPDPRPASGTDTVNKP